MRGRRVPTAWLAACGFLIGTLLVAAATLLGRASIETPAGRIDRKPAIEATAAIERIPALLERREAAYAWRPTTRVSPAPAAHPGRSAQHGATRRTGLALAHVDADARVDAVIELATDATPLTTVAIAAAAIGDADPAVRLEAVSALGERDDEASRSALRYALRDDDLEVRRAAIEALARLGGHESVQALEAVFDDGTPAALRAEAVDALGDIGGEKAIQVLKRVAAAEQVRAVREAARDYLAELAGAQ